MVQADSVGQWHRCMHMSIFSQTSHLVFGRHLGLVPVTFILSVGLLLLALVMLVFSLCIDYVVSLKACILQIHYCQFTYL